MPILLFSLPSWLWAAGLKYDPTLLLTYSGVNPGPFLPKVFAF